MHQFISADKLCTIAGVEVMNLILVPNLGVGADGRLDRRQLVPQQSGHNSNNRSITSNTSNFRCQGTTIYPFISADESCTLVRVEVLNLVLVLDLGVGADKSLDSRQLVPQLPARRAQVAPHPRLGCLLRPERLELVQDMFSRFEGSGWVQDVPEFPASS